MSKLLNNFEANSTAYASADGHRNRSESFDRTSLTANDFTYILGRDFNFDNGPLFSFDNINIDSVGQIYEILNDIGNKILHYIFYAKTQRFRTGRKRSSF
jgi:hypothetical protein